MTTASTAPLLKTPLTEWHRAHGAQLVDFAGWEMPVSYSGIVDEHMAVRERAGLFDVSHMGRLFVRGPGAEAYLQSLITNDLAKLVPGRGLYTVACNEAGGCRDDLIIYKLEGEWMVIMNAGNRSKIVAHFTARLPASGVSLANRSDELAMIAFQGARAPAVMERLAPGALALKRFGIAPFDLFGRSMLVARTGYTGEDGFELFPDSVSAVTVWEGLVATGKDLPVVSCGLGARDGLRLEVGYPLYGHEIDEETSPFEAGLGWTVKLDKGEFLGRAALVSLKASGPRKRLVAFTCAPPGVPRQGYPLTLAGKEVGTVTSGTYSPCLKTGIGTGWVPGSSDPSSPLAVVVRGRACAASVVALPFWKTGSVAVVAKA